MNIAINLLPDTRQKRQKQQEQKRLFTGVILIVLIVCGAGIVIQVLVLTSLKLNNARLTKSIKQSHDKLVATTDLNNALTLQAQLGSLDSLYSQRAYISNFFSVYSQANPSGLSLGSLKLEDNSSMSVNGTSANYANVAKLARALSQYEVKGTKVFSDVSITTVGGVNNLVSFTLIATVAPVATEKGTN